MRYISTRGPAPVRDFAGVLLAGLAEDGGLYVPESWPRFTPADWRALRGLPYPALAARIMQPFVGDAMPAATLGALCRDAYAGFGHPAVVPLQQLDTGLFVQELFHGPTLAFKDMALQLVGRLFDHVLAAPRARVTIVGATSGDTGSAAIEACRGRDATRYRLPAPARAHQRGAAAADDHGAAPNVGNIAVDGTFDDCQDLVKAMFADAPFRADMHLSAMNSINWARIAAQMPYYVAAGAGAGRAGSGGGVQRADRQFRQRPGRLGGAAHGPADRAADRRLQPQRYPCAVPGEQRHVDRGGGAEPVAEHGHPGQLEFRAAAVRAAGARREGRPPRRCRPSAHGADGGAGRALAPLPHAVPRLPAG